MEEILVDLITVSVSLLAIVVSLVTFNRTSSFSKYQDVDQSYMNILKIGIEYPLFRDISKTKNYDKNFDADEKIKHENYAYMVWNFCETLYDRNFYQNNLARCIEI
jgi:hypothetical protein